MGLSKLIVSIFNPSLMEGLFPSDSFSSSLFPLLRSFWLSYSWLYWYCTKSKCSSKWVYIGRGFLNFFPHTLHSKIGSECLSKCTFMVLFLEKCLEHEIWGHLNGFSPVWNRKWSNILCHLSVIYEHWGSWHTNSWNFLIFAGFKHWTDRKFWEFGLWHFMLESEGLVSSPFWTKNLASWGILILASIISLKWSYSLGNLAFHWFFSTVGQGVS